MLKITITERAAGSFEKKTEFETDIDGVDAVNAFLLLTADEKTQRTASLAAAVNGITYSKIAELITRNHLGIL